MKLQFNQVEAEQIITAGTSGVVNKHAIVLDSATRKNREIEACTVINVVSFNFFTKKIVINCIKGLNSFNAEVSVDFLISNCSLNPVTDLNQEVKAVMVQHVKHNLIDKEVLIYILGLLTFFILGLLF